MNDFIALILSSYEDPFSVWQIMGWLAVPIYLISYQFLKTKHTMAAQIPADVLYVLHFYGLGAIVAALVAATSPIRNLLGIFGSDKQVFIGLIVTTLFAWIVGILLANDLLMFLPVIATTFKSMAIFFRDNFWKYRLCLLLFQLFYLAVFISIGSYAGTFLVTITLLSNLIGNFRFLLKSYLSKTKKTIR